MTTWHFIREIKTIFDFVDGILMCVKQHFSCPLFLFERHYYRVTKSVLPVHQAYVKKFDYHWPSECKVSF